MCLASLITNSAGLTGHAIYTHVEEKVLSLIITCSQDRGRRAIQQDVLWNGSTVYQEPNLPAQEMAISEDKRIHLAVADGVSSSPYGHRASMTVIRDLRRELDQCTPFDGRLIRRIHGHLCDALAKGETLGSATTIVAAQIVKMHCKILSVGDSRAYHVDRNGEWVQLTRDSTILNDLIDNGEADVDTEYASFYNMLESCLVANDEETEFLIHASEATLLEGEALLLCTDGVHGVLGNTPLWDLYDPALTGLAQIERWNHAITSAGAYDNFSLILVRHKISVLR